MSRGSLLLSAVAFETALLVAALLILRWAGLHPLTSFRAAAIGTGGVAGLAMAAFAIVLVRSRGAALARIRRDFDLFISLFRRSTTLDLAVIALLAGICEEVLFRGLLQTWLASVMQPHIALALAALAFGISHAISPSYLIFVTLLGLCLGYVYYFTGSLAAAACAHMLYDFLALYYGTRIHEVPEVSMAE